MSPVIYQHTYGTLTHVQRLLTWFHNHTRGTTSGSGTQGILKVAAAPKMLQAWQAYHWYRLTYDPEWNNTIDETWKKYQSDWEAENPGVKPPKKHFVIMNDFIRKNYAEETPERVKEVDEFWKKLKDEEAATPEDKNKKYQAYV